MGLAIVLSNANGGRGTTLRVFSMFGTRESEGVNWTLVPPWTFPSIFALAFFLDWPRLLVSGLGLCTVLWVSCLAVPEAGR